MKYSILFASVLGEKNTHTSLSVVKLQAKWNKSLKEREREGKDQGFRIQVVLSNWPTIVGVSLPLLCLKTEADPVSEMWGFLNPRQ
jgi:hypothetical protein